MNETIKAIQLMQQQIIANTDKLHALEVGVFYDAPVYLGANWFVASDGTLEFMNAFAITRPIPLRRVGNIVRMTLPYAVDVEEIHSLKP